MIDLPKRAAPAWGPAAALAATAAVAVAAWWAPLGGAASRAVPVAAAAVLLAARRPSRSLGAAALAILVFAAPLLAGVAPAELLPTAWPALPGRLFSGLEALVASHVAHGPWSVAAALLFAGAAWIGAATLVAQPSRVRVCAAVVAAFAPWAGAALLLPASAAPWQGALLALGGVLWWSSTRLVIRSAVTVSLVLAALSGVAAQVIAPRQPWFDLPRMEQHVRPPFTTLEAVPTYGPLDRRTGAPMLDIAADEPALWRMQTLDVFDGSGWRFDAVPAPPLAQPAARRVSVEVRVRGLRNDLVVAPGRIDTVLADEPTTPAAGEARRLRHPPGDGSTYRVRAQVVQANAGALRRAPNPTGAALTRYTVLGYPGTLHKRFSDPLAALFGIPRFPRFPGGEVSLEMPLFGVPADRTTMLAGTPYREVAALAERLAAPARTQWQVVTRVMSYLQDGDRFRYTTQLPEPGRFPLVDFLLRDRAGDCQHFAGAAALLLRLAGVPARVVAGFATGVRENGRYRVRDLDAHDWVEVYFQGHGWVPFNATPAAAAAEIPRALDVLAPPDHKRGRGAAALLAALALAAAAVSGVRRRRRREPRLIGDRLASRARGTGARVGAASTLSELRGELERAIGPRTAALASEAEQARFAPGPPLPLRRPRLRIAVALVADTGLWRAVRTAVLARARRPAADL